ncbi:hypothetical protein CEXT_523961 [Caerostris extrusa]|uniref:Uncharacterized protein n=1 Tax=Caerostris extrusa TaxID=172846 RepID=A0AAV4QDL3_CAEEX|nr:hypothetical protein CEXT_523961 [Caerostris extrusa]
MSGVSSAESLALQHVLGAVEGELRRLQQEARYTPARPLAQRLQGAQEHIPSREEESHGIADEYQDQEPRDGAQALAHLFLGMEKKKDI